MLDIRDIAPEGARPIRRTEYEHMVDRGFFEGERVELLYGVIVRMSPHGPEHDDALDRLASELQRLLAGRGRVRVQSGFAASDGSEPEPDIAVVPPGDYAAAHPASAWLVVEVAQSSLAKDLGPKARLYAESAVAEYWVVDLVHREIVVHTQVREGRYESVRRCLPGEVIVAQLEGVEVPVDSVLARA